MALWKMKTQKTQWIVLGIIAISLCIIVPTIIYLPKYFTIHYKSYVTTPLRSQNDTIHDKSFDTTPLRSDYEKGLGYQESKGFDNVREQNVIDVWDSAQLELQERLKSASEKKVSQSITVSIFFRVFFLFENELEIRIKQDSYLWIQSNC